MRSRSSRSRAVVAVILILLLSPPGIWAEKEIRISAGHSVDIWWGVNVSGNIYYIIRSRDGNNTVKFWWVKWGTGWTETVGPRSNSGTLRIPISFFKGVLAAKLRASSDVDAVVYIQENSAPATGLTFHW